MNRLKTSHPGEERLLQYADGELSNRDAAGVRAHLEACWRCRADIDDLQETITEYVRYEQVVSGTPRDPPEPWDGFEARLDRLISQRQNRWPYRASQVLGRLFTNRRISGAALAAIALGCFAILELNRTPSVSAAELLQKATAKEGSTAQHRRLRIGRGTRSFTRAAIVAASDSPDTNADVETRNLFLAADYSWENPLSAASFAVWRDRLQDRHDEVALLRTGENREAAVYQIRTSTRSSSLEEATLNVRAADLNVVSGTFRFRSNEWVDMTALPDEPTPIPGQSVPRSPHSVAAAPDQLSPRGPSEPAQELRVLAALHQADADLGEQVEMRRDDDGRLIVSATGLTSQRQEALRNALSSMSEVLLRFREPTVDLTKPVESQSATPPRSSARTPLQLRLEQTLGGAAALANFADGVLEASEAATVRVHDLRKLAERFSPDIERQLDQADRAILARLRRDHAQALVTRTTELRRLVSPVLLSLGVAADEAVAPPPNPASWQTATQTLFAAGQQLDLLLAALLTGDGTEPPDGIVAAANRALKQLSLDVDWYQSVIEKEQRY